MFGRLVVWLLGVLLLGGVVWGFNYSNTSFSSAGVGLVLNVSDSLVAFNVSNSSYSMFLDQVSFSNPAQSGLYNLSFNLSLLGSYNALDLPYASYNDSRRFVFDYGFVYAPFVLTNLSYYFSFDSGFGADRGGFDGVGGGDAVINDTVFLLGAGVSCNNTGYVNLSGVRLNEYNASAVRVWVRLKQAGVSGSVVGDLEGHGWRLYLNNGVPRFSDYWSAGNGVDLNADGGLTPIVWHQLVGVINGTSSSLYVDGVLNKTGVAVSVNDNYKPAYLCADPDASGNPSLFFNGNVDELGVWNRSLSSAEVLADFNGRVGSNPLASDADIDVVSANLFGVGCAGRPAYVYYPNGSDLVFPVGSYSCSNSWAGFDLSLPVGVTSVSFNQSVSPLVQANFSVPSGFQNFSVNISMRCVTDYFSNASYSMSFNGVSFFNGTLDNGSVVFNVTTARDGVNYVVGECVTPFGNASVNYSAVVYAKTLFLWDEVGNVPFNVSGVNVSGVKVFFDDNSSLFDFQDNGVSYVNFTSGVNDKLRVELSYADGGVIIRYVDVSLVGDLRVCANEGGVLHIPQFILSGTQRRVLMKNVFSSCYVAADYTRFGVGTGFMLKAWTIDSLYSLFAFDNDGNEYLLSSLDGSVSSDIQLDSLIISNSLTDLTVLQDALVISKDEDVGTQVIIYYANPGNDNSGVSLVVKNLDTNAVVLSESGFSSPNNFTVFFNFATLSNVSNGTVFQAILTATRSDGSVSVIKKYFNGMARTIYVTSKVAFLVSFLLVLFGMTMTVARLAFSWLGVVVIVSAIGLLAVSPLVWYTLFLMAVEFIMLVYVVIVMTMQGPQTVT